HPDFRQHPLEHDTEEIALIGKLIIKRAARQPRLTHNVLGARRRKTARRKEPPSGLQQLFTVLRWFLGRSHAGFSHLYSLYDFRISLIQSVSHTLCMKEGPNAHRRRNA